MARSSPAVHRVASVLNFFAEHPGYAFTLTDLVKGLKLSRATCHALLVGLVDVGYLYRTSEKTYVLGPALAAIGRSASTNYSPLQVAQPEMRALADEFDAICSAFFRDGNDVVARERAAAVSHLGWSIARGARLPLRPPFAAIFFAWSPPAEADSWLDGLDPPVNARQRAQMLESMAFAREYGFLCMRVTRPPVVSATTDWLVSGGASSPVEIMLKFELDRDYAVSAFDAPVFGADGRVAFVIGLVGMTGTRSGTEIMRIGTRLREACNRISSFSTPLRVAAGR
jgi:DNA-binding IclR family transcriptional regulator